MEEACKGVTLANLLDKLRTTAVYEPDSGKSRHDPPGSCRSYGSYSADTEAWNTVEQTGFHIYIAALALTDHSYSIEFFQTNQQNPSPTIELYIVIYTSAPRCMLRLSQRVFKMHRP
jgi:hypothetical protein